MRVQWKFDDEAHDGRTDVVEDTYESGEEVAEFLVDCALADQRVEAGANRIVHIMSPESVAGIYDIQFEFIPVTIAKKRGV
jgi:hypothetical protein